MGRAALVPGLSTARQGAKQVLSPLPRPRGWRISVAATCSCSTKRILASAAAGARKMWLRCLSMCQVLTSAATGSSSLSMRLSLEACWAGAGAASCTVECAHRALRLLDECDVMCCVVWSTLQSHLVCRCLANALGMRCWIKQPTSMHAVSTFSEPLCACTSHSSHLHRLYGKEVAVKGADTCNSRAVVQ